MTRFERLGVGSYHNTSYGPSSHYGSLLRFTITRKYLLRSTGIRKELPRPTIIAKQTFPSV
jgi:hypothetical protein